MGTRVQITGMSATTWTDSLLPILRWDTAVLDMVWEFLLSLFFLNIPIAQAHKRFMHSIT